MTAADSRPTPLRPGVTLLSQYLVGCPRCGRSAAVHVDDSRPGMRSVVRFVCADGCRVDDATALSTVPVSSAAVVA
jgi:hypothetical protein